MALPFVAFQNVCVLFKFSVSLPINPSNQSGLQTEEMRNQLQVLERILSTSFRDQDLFEQTRDPKVGQQLDPPMVLGEVNPGFSQGFFWVLKIRIGDEKRYTNRKLKTAKAVLKQMLLLLTKRISDIIAFPFGIFFSRISRTKKSFGGGVLVRTQPS